MVTELMLDFLDGTVLGAAGNLGDLLDDVVAFDHFAEDAVLVVEPRRGGDGDEELAAVGAGPALAMERKPALVCFSVGWNSSANL